MAEKYADRMKHKAERLAQISAELDALHAQATGLLSGGEHHPHEGALLAQLGDARQALAGYVPTVRAEASEAAGGESYAAGYLARVYGRAGTGQQGAHFVT